MEREKSSMGEFPPPAEAPLSAKTTEDPPPSLEPIGAVDSHATVTFEDVVTEFSDKEGEGEDRKETVMMEAPPPMPALMVPRRDDRQRSPIVSAVALEGMALIVDTMVVLAPWTSQASHIAVVSVTAALHIVLIGLLLGRKVGATEYIAYASIALATVSATLAIVTALLWLDDDVMPRLVVVSAHSVLLAILEPPPPRRRTRGWIWRVVRFFLIVFSCVIGFVVAAVLGRRRSVYHLVAAIGLPVAAMIFLFFRDLGWGSVQPARDVISWRPSERRPDPRPAVEDTDGTLPPRAEMVLASRHFTITHVNEEFLELLGMDVRDVLGRPFDAWLVAVDAESVADVLAAVRESFASGRRKSVLLRMGGRVVGERVIGRPVAVVVDAVKRGGVVVLQPPAVLSLLEHSSLPLMAVQRKSGDIVLWNRALELQMSYSAYNMIGRNASRDALGLTTEDAPLDEGVGSVSGGQMVLAYAIVNLGGWCGLSPHLDLLVCLMIHCRNPAATRMLTLLEALARLIRREGFSSEDLRQAVRELVIEEIQDGLQTDPPTNRISPTPEMSAVTAAAPSVPAWGRLTSRDTTVCRSALLPRGQREFRVGRSQKCDIMVSDSFVSGVQFSVVFDGTTARLVDHSVNGTFINLQPVGKGCSRVLRSRDLLSFRLSTNRHFLGFLFERMDDVQRGRAPLRVPTESTRSFEWTVGTEVLGKGGNAEVLLGINRTNGRLIAVKRVLVSQGPRERRRYRAMLDEIAVLSRASHPNIVHYFGAVQDATHLNILLEFVPGGSVRHLLDNFGPLSGTIVLRYLRQALEGLLYLHANGIVHGDIKCANILVTDRGEVKLTDFGTAKFRAIGETMDATPTRTNNTQTRKRRPTVTGTLLWMAPEIVRGTAPPTSAADVWSLGCALVEMMTGEHPWAEYELQSERDILAILQQSTEPPEIPDFPSPLVLRLTQRCLQLEPAARPSAAQLIAMLESSGIRMPRPNARALERAKDVRADLAHTQLLKGLLKEETASPR